VMVSPNMTYPLKVKADATKLIVEAPAKRAAFEVKLTDAALIGSARVTTRKALAKLEKDVTKAEEDLIKYADKTTSMMGLEEPLIKLKNPGIISIPLGFLAVIFGSLLWGRDRRSEEKWTELYVRQNTGLGASSAHAH